MGALIRLTAFILWLSRDIPSARLAFAITVSAGIVSGMASTGLIVVINFVLSEPGPLLEQLSWAFVGLCVILPAFRLISHTLLIFLSQRSFLELRMKLARLALQSPLVSLEEVGPHRLFATMINDVRQLMEALRIVPTLFIHFTIVFSSLVYLGWLDGSILLQVLGFIVLGVVTYQLPIVQALKYQRKARERVDLVTDHIRSLVEGIKELKMHRFRRQAFLGDLGADARSLQRLYRTGGIIFYAASSWGQILFFVVVGLLLLVLPLYQTIEIETLVAFILVLFHLMTPLEVILGALPVLGSAAVAADKVERLGLRLQAAARKQEPDAPTRITPDWTRLELRGIVHSYKPAGRSPQEAREEAAVSPEETFRLGPVDLCFEPGELVFLIGGNGSGKTTFAKLLLGLYAPQRGEIRFAGDSVTDENRDSYRENFSAVFSDFFLFKRLLGLNEPVIDDVARGYLKRLHLEKKVEIVDGMLTTLDLSQGQRKRLALLTAYLENRPIYLFDEWAADQDPIFKEFFYLEILPEFKARGKTVFVISHDDHYYHVADRIIKFDYGKVEYDRAQAELSEETGRWK